MTLPTSDTRVSYPDGAVASSGTVLHVAPLADGRSAVILDRTPAHPVDRAWPDQPADRGVLRWEGAGPGAVEAPLLDVVTGGVHADALLLGAELPVRIGTPEWVFVVGHVIDGPPPAVGVTVEVEVDAAHRHALSAGHTACHLASLALDAALEGAWSKPVRADALGFPGFDGAAIQTSRIEPNASVDVYRVGKSLRRAGFDPAALDDPDAVAERANALLAGWVASGAPVRIERDDEALSSRRAWVCELPDAEARIPCGGTHLTSLAELRSVSVALAAAAVPGGIELTMRTTALSRA